MAEALDLNGPHLEALLTRGVASAQAAPQSDEKEGLGLLAKLIYAAGGGADVASTAYGMSTGKVQESNPMVNWAPKAAQIPLGVGMEVGTVALLNKLMGKKHPKVMKGILMALGGAHGGLALKNISTIRDAQNDPTAPPPAPMPSNLTQRPDGSWADPAFFPER